MLKCICSYKCLNYVDGGENMITYYINELLTPKLKKFGVSDSFCNHTVAIVMQQITSLLSHWDDISFRKSVLLIGM